MRLTAILLTICSLHVAGHTTAQITYQGKEVSIRKVLEVVRVQGGIYMAYNEGDLEQAKPVTVSLKNSSVKEALDEIFKDQPLTYSIVNKTVFVIKKTSIVSALSGAQDPPITVRGKVINEDGDPVAGVTIQVKGSNNATASDGEGEFELHKVAPDGVLVLSAVNVKAMEAPVNGKRELSIQVRGKTSILDQIQIIAYGTNSQRYNVGSVSSVKAADIQKQPINNPLMALQGRVPGVSVVQQSGLPGSGFKIYIRGQNSINSGSEPLYVVDGVPIKPNVNGVDGSGQNGLASGPLGATPSALFYINPADIESIDVLKDADATAIYGSRGANGVVLITTKKGKAGATRVDARVQSGWGEVAKKIDMLNTPQYLEMRKEAYKNDNTALPTTPNATNYDLTAWDQQKYTDWQDKLIGRSASYTDAQASITGGNSAMQYLVGANYHKETTVFNGNFSDQKGGVHFSLSGNSPSQKLKVNLTGSYVYDNNQLPSGDQTQFINLSPNAPDPLNPDGTLNWAPLPSGTVNTFFRNPYAVLKNVFQNKVNNLMSSALISYRIIDNLEIKSTVGYNILQSDSYSAAPFAAINPLLWSTSIRTASFASTSSRSFTVDPQITYRLPLFKGNFDFLAGMSIQQSTAKYQKIDAAGFTSDAAMKNLIAATSFTPNYGTSQYKYYALFARIGYNWDGKYILSLNGRRDASSRFGPGKQYANFGSAGVGWIFSRENFIKDNLSFLSFGKLRFSYGTAGNDQIGDYKYLEIYNYTNQLYQSERGLVTNGLYNPYYAWEITRKMEGGLELGFFMDRVVLNASYYRNRSSNQLLTLQLPVYAGPANNLLGNTPALVQNDGLEVVLNTINVRTEKFTWSTSLNASFGRNKLIRNYNPLNSPDLSVSKPLGYNLLFHSIGVDPLTGLYTFADVSGQPTSTPTNNARTVFFNLNFPRYFGGIQNNLSYKGFQLDFLFQFVKQQGRIFMYDYSPGAFYNQPVSVLNRWQKAGDVTTVQKYSRSNTQSTNAFNNARNNSDLGFGDASYIRLKNASLSWQFPASWLKTLKMTNARLYVLGQNLWTITKYKGLDPETLSNSSLPPLRIITVGAQLTL